MNANQRHRRPRKNSAAAGESAATTDSAAMAWIAVGEVVGAFGLQGEVKVLPLTDFPDRFARTPTVYLGDARTPRAVRNARVHQRVVIVKLEGVDEVAAAQRMRGTVLWIPEADRMAIATDEFYLYDVVGLRVVHVDGQPLGTVADFIVTGGNDLFVVRTPNGREVLLPAVREFIREVDIPGGVLRVAPIPGLFDDAAENAGDADSPNALEPADEANTVADTDNIGDS